MPIAEAMAPTSLVTSASGAARTASTAAPGDALHPADASPTTTAGGRRTPGSVAPAPPRLPTGVARLLHTTAALVWFGTFAFYVRVWLAPQESDGALYEAARHVVDGTAQAPFQYRTLMPNLLMWLHDQLGWSIGFGEAVVDALMLATGIAVTHAVMRRLGLEIWVIVVAVYGAFLGVGMLWWGKFETITAFAAMAVATWAVLCDDRRRWVPLAGASLLLAGTRTDLLVVLGVALVARWLFAGRQRRDLIGGLALGASGVATAVAWTLVYPDARYDPAAPAIQIVHNIQPLVLLIAIAFALPAVGPYLLARSQAPIRELVQSNRSTMVPLLAIAGAQLGAIAVVGRIDETRLLFPIATTLGLLAVLGWRAILAPYADAATGTRNGSEGL